MDDSSSYEPRAKRQKKDPKGKLAAFERLKQLKGSKNKYEVNEVNNVYDVVDEKEYSKRVINRQVEDWIVNDDGSGYVEDGREIFDDDLDADSIAAAAASASKEHGSRKKKKKAVSEQAVKGNLQYMLSNMPTKKEKTKLEEDNILSELMSELDDSEATSSSATPKRSSKTSVFSEKKAASDYVKSFSSLKPRVTPVKSVKFNCTLDADNSKSETKILKEIEINQTNILRPNTFTKKETFAEREPPKIQEPEPETNVNGDVVTDCPQVKNEISSLLDDDLDMDQIGDVEETLPSSVMKTELNVTEEQLLNGWETMQEGTLNNVECDINVNSSQIPLVTNDEGKDVFRFFWWDAYENVNVRPGEIQLFGKTYCESAKSYVSCTVAIKNIERKIYLLPRLYHLDEESNQTDKPVALIDVYHEFNNNIAPFLLLQSFKSRKVSKNYCFDSKIPTQSEYLEIRYSAKHKRVDNGICNDGGKTFSKIFGSRSTFLEIFLLERKIKGPCWIEIMNPEAVVNPVSYSKFEINCSKPTDVSVIQNKNVPPPPMVVMTLNIRSAINPKTMNSEIVMISVLVHTKYAVDKKPPNPLFEQHFCVFTRVADQMLPSKMHEALMKFKATRVQKMDTERALLNYFLAQFSKIDPDLVVGHDLQDYQIGLICERLLQCKATNFCRLSKLKLKKMPSKRILEKELFNGRLVCDIKISSKESIRSRSYDLQTLCQTILKVKDGERMEVDAEDVLKFYKNSEDILKLITYTMQDCAYILKMMYELNVIPLALQITNIAGNVMSQTLLGGRSQRNEFLLLHAFYERDYIVPEKYIHFEEDSSFKQTQRSTSSKKKPTYLGGLVLDPKVGFYDKLILLMDFNSLYPSIIQEYNICFTTIPPTEDDSVVLPDQNLPSGILPTEIRKLVESRREVKKLMKTPDLSLDLMMQYNIRQMALKLTANSMYGCLGFTNSRFYAKNLAALVTYKGREILTNTKDLVSKLCYDVIYGDTDSIMINTNNLDYDEVMKIGIKIKQEINKLYKQVELDIDGVFKYLLLLKKKKYAAMILTKDANGELKTQQEFKGLDIVRRDWSQLAGAAGRFILDNILSEQSFEERIENIHLHLTKLKEDLEQSKVPLSLLVITKQLTKDPRMYADKNQLPHVQVALRYNKKGGRILKAGDTVPYIICEDGSSLSATHRAYHVEELKNSDTLKIDVKYYLAQQIHPVVSRLCDPLEGIDAYTIGECLGLDTSGFKKALEKKSDNIGESLKNPEIKFFNVDPFKFQCITCKTENIIKRVSNDKVPFLAKCTNPNCDVRPIDYLPCVQNQLTVAMRGFIKKYYGGILICEDPSCPNETAQIPFKFAAKFPVCNICNKGVMYKQFTENDLYNQLSFFQYIFDLSRHDSMPIMEANIKAGYRVLKETVDNVLKHSAYAVIDLTRLYSNFWIRDKETADLIIKEEAIECVASNVNDEEEDEYF